MNRKFGNDQGDNFRSSAKSSQLPLFDGSETTLDDSSKTVCCEKIFGNEERETAGGCCSPPPVNKVGFEKLIPYHVGVNSEISIVKHPTGLLKDKSLKFRCRPEEIVIPKKQKYNLGIPVGTSFGSFNLKYVELSEKERVLQGYATCLIGFAEIYLTPEHEWTIIVINRILDDGKKLIENSIVDDKELSETNVYKRFVVCKNTMEIEIYEPSYVGKILSDDVTIPNLKDSLHKFFVHEKYCLLWIGDYYFLIWKSLGLFFCFDCYGRTPKKCIMDEIDGFASLVCVRNIDNIYHLVVNLSNITPHEMFTLRRIQMIKLLKCCEMAELFDDHKRKFEYRIVNDRYSILFGHLHLGSECFREFRFKQSLAVAIVALIYSKIDISCTWDGYIIDQVLILGTEFYKTWTFCDHCFDLGIQDVPGRFAIGQFTVDIIVNPIQESGQWQCIPNYRHSNLTKAIKRSFEKSANILVQIERKTYPLWKRNNFYYLLDPFEHQSITGGEKTKTSLLHMCSTLNVLCCKFTQIILEIATSRPFYIHLLKICNVFRTDSLRKTDYIECSCITKRPDMNDNDEIKSMNDSVVDIRCKKEFYCLLDSGEIEEDFVADLDSPGLSETQIIPEYINIRGKVLGLSDEEGMEGAERTDSSSRSEFEDDGNDEDEKAMTECINKLKKLTDNKEFKKARGKSKGKDNAESGAEGDGEGGKDGADAKDGAKSSRDADGTEVEDSGRDSKLGDGKGGNGKDEDGKGGDGKGGDGKGGDGKGDGKGGDGKNGDGKGGDGKGGDGKGGDGKGGDGKGGDGGDGKGGDGKGGNGKGGNDNGGDGKGGDAKGGDGKGGDGKGGDSKGGDGKGGDGKGGDGKGADDKEGETKLADGKGGKDGKKGNESDTDGKKTKDGKRASVSGGVDGARAGAEGKESVADNKAGNVDAKKGGADGKETGGKEGGTDGKAKDTNEKGGTSDSKGGSKGDEGGVDSRERGKGAGKDTGKGDGDTDEDGDGDGDGGGRQRKAKSGKSSRGAKSKKRSSDGADDDIGDDESGKRGKNGDGKGGVYLDEADCQPNSYPGYCPIPRNIAVIGSESGTYESICNLLKTGFKCADRVLTMTPWGNYVVFKSVQWYFLFDGCTCNVQKFRHLDLRMGTAGLICFEQLHDLVNHILNGKNVKKPIGKDLKLIIDEICDEYS